MYDENNKRDWLLTLEKGIRVIRAFDQKNTTLTISQVADFCNLDRATTRRALLTLVGLGYAREDGTAFRLTPKVMQLAAPFLTSHSFVRIIQPTIEDFQKRTKIATSVSVLDDCDIVYVARVEQQHLLKFDIAIGSRLPAHLTALGRVLLANLPDDELAATMDSIRFDKPAANSVGSRRELTSILKEVRSQGFSVVDQELEGGLVAIAVPIRNDAGAVVASLGASSHIGICTASELVDRYLDRLNEVSAEISEGLLSYLHPRPSPRKRTSRQSPVVT